MSRWMSVLSLIGLMLLALPLTLALAQEGPPAVPPPPFLQTQSAPPGGPGSPPGGLPGAGPGGQPPFEPVPQQPIEPVPVEPTPEPIPTEEPVVIIDPSVEIALAARLDMELLARNTLTAGRPEGWNGSMDINDPQLSLIARIDLELLAGSLLGANVRPDGWFGVVSSTPYAIARDIRHDLELLADQMFGNGQRPEGWAGSEPLMRCDRATQAMVRFLELNGVFALQADRTAPDFCAQASVEASLFMEVNILANPSSGNSLVVTGLNTFGGGASVNSPYSAAFFDRGAARRAGVVPDGTAIEPVARSYAQFSNMMLIRGGDFEVFVDYRFTSVTEEQFLALPNIESVAHEPFCAARWCGN